MKNFWPTEALVGRTVGEMTRNGLILGDSFDFTGSCTGDFEGDGDLDGDDAGSNDDDADEGDPEDDDELGGARRGL